MSVDTLEIQSLLKKYQQDMRKGDPEYHLACVVQEVLSGILADWETAGSLFQSYLTQEEQDRLEHYLYCYEWGQVMGRCSQELSVSVSFPTLPERKTHPAQLDQLTKEQGGQLRRLWRRYQAVTWKRRIYESAYLTLLGMENGQGRHG